MTRLLVVVVLASVLAVAGPARRAEACSCAMEDPSAMLESSDAAFVGTVVQRPEAAAGADGGATTGVWVFEVEKWTKGDLGEVVGVHAPLDSGGGCGLAYAVGDRAGIFLYNDGGRPTSNMCLVTSPEAMLAAAQPLVFDGQGPPVFLVASATGRNRLATLDASGRLLAAVGDDRSSWSTTMCPGQDLLVEVVEGSVVVRDAATLEEVRIVEPSAEGQAQEVWCLDGSAEVILGHVWSEDGSTSGFRLLGPDSEVFTDAQTTYMYDAGGDHLAIVPRPADSGVDVIDVRTGERRRLADGLDVSVLAFSPSGDRLMVAETEYLSDGGYTTVAAVFDPSNGDAVWTSPPIEDGSVYGWIDESRLSGDHYPIEADESRGLVLEVGTESVSETRSAGGDLRPVNGGLVAVVDGKLQFTPSGGAPAVLAALPTPMHYLLAVLEPAAELHPLEPHTTVELEATEESTVTSAPKADAAFPTGVVTAAVAGIALVLAVGWRAIRRRPS